jgi:hypothetical protein
MPERELPSTPEESVAFLDKAKKAGEKKRRGEEEEGDGGETKVEKATAVGGVPPEAAKKRAEMEAEVREEEEKRLKEVREKIEKSKFEPKEFDGGQRLPPQEEKAAAKEFKKGRLGLGGFTKGAVAAPLVLGAGAVFLAYKVAKALFWDHWLKKYFGGALDLLKGEKKG